MTDPQAVHSLITVERPAANPAVPAGVQVIRIDRPAKTNALTRPMYAAMTEALVAGERDAAVRAHVVFGQPGAFSAGNDLGDFLEHAQDGDIGREVIAFLKTLASLEKPLLSGVDGLAIGIGTTLHLHCDLTFATPRSLFRTPFTDLGLVAEAASSLLAPATMGHQRAFALLAAGESFSAEAAREAGLIWQVVEENALETAVLDAASALAAKPPEALRITRALMRTPRAGVLARIDEEAGYFAAQLRTEETRAAIAAFFERGK